MLPLLILAAPTGTDLPIRLVSGHIVVEVTFDGKVREPFMLDTGSVGTFITKKGAETLQKAGIKAEGTQRLSLNGLKVAPVTVRPVPEAVERGFDKSGIRGMLGLDVLANYQLGLDVAQKRARLWPKGAQNSAIEWFGKGPFQTTPLFKHLGYLSYVTISNLTTPLVVDTGAADTYLAEALAKRVEGFSEEKRDFVVFNDGLHATTRAKVPLLRWAGLDLPSPNYVNRGDGPYGSTGLLGLDVLERLVLILDFPGKKVLVAGQAAKPEGFTYSEDERPKLLGPGGEFLGEGSDGSATLRGWNGVVPRLWSVVKGKEGETVLIPPSENLRD